MEYPFIIEEKGREHVVARLYVMAEGEINAGERDGSQIGTVMNRHLAAVVCTAVLSAFLKTSVFECLHLSQR